jgi:hypothetical protein
MSGLFGTCGFHDKKEEPMNRQHTSTVILALIAGLVGGMVSSQFFVKQLVVDKKKPPHEKVIRAEKFEVVDSDGKLRAVLGEVVRKARGYSVSGLENKQRKEITFKSYELVIYTTEGEERTRLSDGLCLVPFVSTDILWTQGCSIRDGESKPRIVLSSGTRPSIVLRDTQGRDRAVIGCVGLEVSATGETQERPESSLVLFGQDGKVVWSAP